MPIITMKTVFCRCPGQAARQVRNGSTAPQDFHSKYGTGVMIGGAVFCTAVWSYVSSPVKYKYDLNKQIDATHTSRVLVVEEKEVWGSGIPVNTKNIEKSNKVGGKLQINIKAS